MRGSRIATCAFASAASLSAHTYAAGNERVASHIEWPVDGIWNCSAEGTVKGTFVAMPAGDGSWDVSATFRPQSARMSCQSGGPGTVLPLTSGLHGSGVSQFNAFPDISISFLVDGLYWGNGKDNTPAYFGVTVIVGLDGVVRQPVYTSNQDTAALSPADSIIVGPESDGNHEEFESLIGSIDLGSAHPQTSSCEEGSYSGTTTGGGLLGGAATRNEAKQSALDLAQSTCAWNCGGFDACPSQKPLCTGNAHVRHLTCGVSVNEGGWHCSGEYQCNCGCAQSDVSASDINNSGLTINDVSDESLDISFWDENRDALRILFEKVGNSEVLRPVLPHSSGVFVFGTDPHEWIKENPNAKIQTHPLNERIAIFPHDGVTVIGLGSRVLAGR